MAIKLSRRAVMVGGGLLIAGCGGEGSSGQPPSPPTPPPPPPPPPPSPPPVAAGNRILGIAPTERADGEFGPGIVAMKEARCRNATLSLAWDDIESAPAVFDPDPNFAEIAAQFFPAQDLSLTLVLVGIDTTADRRPADLKDRAYDDPEAIARFRAMQAWVLDQMSGVELTGFSIGNEIDVTLAGDRDSWISWRNFYNAVAADARAALPGVPVGSKATSNVLRNPVGRAEYGELLKNADASMLTYYPTGPDFDSTQLPAVEQDFDAMVNAYPDLPLRLLECGFSSNPALGSSEQQQAEFVTAVFRAWDTYVANMPQLDYFAVHDFSAENVADLVQYYGLSDQRFAAWLGSLGLRKSDGSPKAGWTRFVEEAVARDF